MVRVNQKDNKIIQFASRKDEWVKTPSLFLEEVLQIRIPNHQRKIIRAFSQYNDVAIASANSVGKTFIISGLSIAFFLTSVLRLQKIMIEQGILDLNTICLITSPNFNQIKTGVFMQIKKFYERANKNCLEKFGVPFSANHITDNRNAAECWYNNDSYILGFSTDKMNDIAGKHGTEQFLILDEAQGIKNDVFSALNGIAMSGQTKTAMLGNTTIVEGYKGRFYEAFHSEHTIYHTIIISAFDTDNFQILDVTLDDMLNGVWRNKVDKYCGTDWKKACKFQQESLWANEATSKMPYPNLIHPVSANKLLQDYDYNINDYEIMTRLLARFPTSSGQTLFRQEWIDAAFHNYDKISYYVPGERSMGVDTGSGRDTSAICVRDGNKVIYLEEFQLTHPELIKQIKNVYSEYNPEIIKVETDGIGSAVYDDLESQNYPIAGIQVGASPGLEYPLCQEDIEESDKAKEFYSRKRDEIWCNLREWMDPHNSKKRATILLPPNDKLKVELKVATYARLDNNKIKIISKDELRKQIKRSTNLLDSVILAFAKVDDITFSGGAVPMSIKSTKWN